MSDIWLAEFYLLTCVVSPVLPSSASFLNLLFCSSLTSNLIVSFDMNVWPYLILCYSFLFLVMSTSLSAISYSISFLFSAILLLRVWLTHNRCEILCLALVVPGLTSCLSDRTWSVASSLEHLSFKLSLFQISMFLIFFRDSISASISLIYHISCII